MKLVLVLMVVSFFLWSCHDVKLPKEPDHLLSKEEMVDVLFDLALVNSAKGVNKKILENNGILPNEYIYKKYQIDSLQFVENNNYYAYRVDEYEEIIQKVMDSIDVLRKQLNREVKEEDEERRVKSDSIKAAKQTITPRKRDSLNKRRLEQTIDKEVLEEDLEGLIVE